VRVIWTPEAEQDRDDIWNYIAADNLVAATLTDKLFSDAAARLVTYPMLGQIGKIPGTRELVWILALVHMAGSGRRCASEKGLANTWVV
jgi:plasmid stabilization system protein ParE